MNITPNKVSLGGDNCYGLVAARPDYLALFQLGDASDLYSRPFVLRSPPQIQEEGKCRITTT
jgi:hypothetical protein